MRKIDAHRYETCSHCPSNMKQKKKTLLIVRTCMETFMDIGLFGGIESGSYLKASINFIMNLQTFREKLIGRYEKEREILKQWKIINVNICPPCARLHTYILYIYVYTYTLYYTYITHTRKIYTASVMYLPFHVECELRRSPKIWMWVSFEKTYLQSWERKKKWKKNNEKKCTNICIVYMGVYKNIYYRALT